MAFAGLCGGSVFLAFGVVFGCGGSTTGRDGGAGTGGASNVSATAAGSGGSATSSNGATGSGGATSTFGGTVQGSQSSLGGASSAGSGGAGGSGGEPFLRVSGIRVNEAEGCLEGESVIFDTMELACGEAPSLQRDAAGQCWWVEMFCDVPGLEHDECSGVGDSPPRCGEGGSAGGTSCEELGCTRSPSQGFCGDYEGEVWICESPRIDYQMMIDAGCIDLATQIPRFCCPEGFHPECR